MKKSKINNLYIISSAELNIRHKNGSRVRSTCPVCSSTRGNPADPSLAADLATGVGYCHHCGARFKIDDHPDRFEERYASSRRTEQPADIRGRLLPMDEPTLAYLSGRGISEKTARAAGVCSRVVWKGGLEMHWVAFPFFRGAKVVNVQYKLADLYDKQFCFEQGGEMVPWNADCIAGGDGSGPLYITEGMMDALALMECGAQHVVSVPNGANSRMDAFARYRRDICRRFAYIVFAGDTDEKGLALRDRVCRYFEDKDVCCVTWRCGDTEAKDADEMLMLRGADAVRECLNRAENEGDGRMMVLDNSDGCIDDLFDNGMPTGFGIGFGDFDALVRFEPGNMLLVTGYPGTGKSSLVNYITMRLLVRYGWRTLFFSPEKLPVKYHEAELISVITGKKFDNKVMGRAEYLSAKKRLEGNVIHISDEVSDLKEIVALAERAVRVNHIRVWVIDPFVYLAMPAIPGSSDTQKIAEMLKEIMLATRRLNLITILVAHPRKPAGDAPSEPSLYEVAGSANFYNFCDSGIILERDAADKTVVKLTCGKTRRDFLGSVGTIKIAYDGSCGRYAPCVRDKGGTFSTAHYMFDKKMWTDEYRVHAEGSLFSSTPDDLPF